MRAYVFDSKFKMDRDVLTGHRITTNFVRPRQTRSYWRTPWMIGWELRGRRRARKGKGQ